MKKTAKIFLIIAVVFMGLGLLLSAGAFVAADFDITAFALTEKDLIEQTADIEGKNIEVLHIENISDANMVYEIRLIPSVDEDFHLRYSVTEIDDIQWTVENETLRIFSPVSEWHQNISLFSSFGVVPLIIEVPSSVITVQCDADVTDLYAESLSSEGPLDFYCDTDAADMMLRDITLGTLNLKGDASDIDLENINVADLEIKCDYGDVTMKNLVVENCALLTVVAGDIEMRTISVGNTLDVFADYGSVDMDDLSADSVMIEVSAGDLDFDALFVESSLEVIADAGDINGSINDSQSAFTVYSNVSVEDTNLFSGGDGSKTMRFTVDAGSVNIVFLK